MKKSTKETRRKTDEHIGEQIRYIRNLRGLSQEKLAEQVDLTFQQLQKYERGANRVSGSVLYEFSQILEVPVERFFQGLEDHKITPLPELGKKHYELIRLYDATSKDVQKSVLRMLKLMAGVFVIFCLSLTGLTVPLYAGETTDLEKAVRERAEKKPETAVEYFLERIESGASVEEQAVYLYGMGLAEEEQGNIEEAINNYLGAEILGNKDASTALDRLEVKRDIP